MPGLIPDHLLEQIRQSTDIVELIQSYIPLKRAGANFRALCPFHKEKTPSFNVHPQRQIFHCFGCGVGGNAFKFLMLYENMTFIEAVRLLAKRAGIPVEEQSFTADPDASSRKEQLYSIHEEICAQYQKVLAADPRGEPARAYLKKRKVSDELVKTFRLGFAPDAWDSVLKWATAKKIPMEVLELTGLVTRNESGKIYDRFRGRLMFPICDEQGRVVGFSGRTLDPDAKEAKYVNSPETPIFSKSKILFGLDKTKRGLLDTRQAVVCEGQLDMMACFGAGVSNVVASQGTAFTELHGRLLKRYVDEVVLTFDSDAAGQNAAVRSVDALLEAGLVVRVASLPQGHDPDSLVREGGAEALQKVLTAAQSFLDFYLQRLCLTHDPRSDKGRAEITRLMAEMLAKIPNAAMSYAHITKTAQRLSLPESVVQSELRKAQRAGRRQMSENGEGVESYLESAKKISTAERELLHLLLAEPELVSIAQEHLTADMLPSGPYKPLLLKILALADTAQWHGAESLQEELADEATASLLSELLLTEPCHRDRAAAVRTYIESFHQDAIHAEREAIQARLADPSLSDEEVSSLQKRLAEMRSQKSFDLRSQDKHITRLFHR